ncbi:hypothetical protein ACFPRL_16450 [Pseudoclavibacter helvolus]
MASSRKPSREASGSRMVTSAPARLSASATRLPERSETSRSCEMPPERMTTCRPSMLNGVPFVGESGAAVRRCSAGVC